jgi:hypothetical protein
MAHIEREKDELLTKTEFRYLFCQKLKIGKSSYYKYYSDYIRFKAFAKYNEAGIVVKKIYRIRYDVAIGIIHVLNDCYNPNKDPAMAKLNRYMKFGAVVKPK